MNVTAQQPADAIVAAGFCTPHPAETLNPACPSASRPVLEEDTDTFMVKLFGPRTWFHAEAVVCASLRRLCPDYYGAAWQLFQLDEACGYMAPVLTAPLAAMVHGQSRPVYLSPEAAGIAATLRGLLDLLARVPDRSASEYLADRHSELLDFSRKHPEADAIAKALA